MQKKVLVAFGELPASFGGHTVVIADKKFEERVRSQGVEFVPLHTLVQPPSIYEASAFVDELSRVTLGGKRISKIFLYKGYELWWINYQNLFLYFGLPFSQYQKLLGFLKDFSRVTLIDPPARTFFESYLSAHTITAEVRTHRRNDYLFSSGILIQSLLTLLCLPVFVFKKYRLVVFTGDKFEKDTDHDFRMRYIYEELRKRNMPFLEVIRGLESSKTLLQHFFFRARPAVYSEALRFKAKILSVIMGGRAQGKKLFGSHTVGQESDPEKRFKLAIATQYLVTVYDDVWAIRLNILILKLIGARAMFFSAAMERNYPTVLATKLLNIATVGILHGVASRFYNVYDFIPGYDGTKSISVDKYGVWSEWWKKYYTEHSRAYTPGQLVVSGLMRPFPNEVVVPQKNSRTEGELIRVLFISEQLAVPEEVVPYLEKLLSHERIVPMVSFRPYRDGFKNWLDANRPDLASHPRLRFAEDGLARAVEDNDIVVGSHSTAVLEALIQYKIPLFFDSRKWGDYYDLKAYDAAHTFFAENPQEFIQKIENARTISIETLADLRARYFGDPTRNGSAWVVDELEKALESKL